MAVDTVLAVQRDARHLQRHHAEACAVIKDIQRNRGYFKDRQQQQQPSSAASRSSRGPSTAPPFRRWNPASRSPGGPSTSPPFRRWSPSGSRGRSTGPPPRGVQNSRAIMQIPMRPLLPSGDLNMGPCLHCGRDRPTRECRDPRRKDGSLPGNAHFASAVSFFCFWHKRDGEPGRGCSNACHGRWLCRARCRAACGHS